jgi:hypothetical protein
MPTVLWQRVGELADRAPRVSDLRYHRLHLVAASRARVRGDVVPVALRAAQRDQAAVALATPRVLARVRDACDGPLILMKGAAAAAHWDDARLRPWTDADLLVEDPATVQRALLAAGFVEVGERRLYEPLHHLPPLGLPGEPVLVEVHRRPHWPYRRTPAFAEIAAAARPGALGIDGLLAPDPAQHAVLLAGHAWAHEPLGRIGQLIDVAAAALAGGLDAAAAVARDWGAARIWDATARSCDALLLDGRPAPGSRTWARHLQRARERTVLEQHLGRIGGAMTRAPRLGAPAAGMRAAARTLSPSGGEPWPAKLRRSGRAVRDARIRRSDHNDDVHELEVMTWTRA